MEILAEYKRRRAAFAGELAEAQRRVSAWTAAALVAIAALVALGIRAWQGNASPWTAAAPLVALLLVGVLRGRERRRLLRAMRLEEWYAAGVGRAEGTEPQSGRTGEAFRRDGHRYDRDLGILGPDSVFGLLAVTRTSVGERELARYLLQPVNAAQARARQSAVRELAPKLELRERVALLGRSAFAELPVQGIERWLSGNTGGFAPWQRWVMAGLVAAWTILLATGLLRGEGLGSLRNVEAIVAVQAAFALWLRPRVQEELDAAERLGPAVAILQEGLQVLKAEPLDVPLLRTLQDRAAGSQAAVQSLLRALQLAEQRAKEWYYVPGLLLGVGTQAAIALRLWRVRHGAALREWVSAWGEMEALLALSAYAAEHPAHCWPALLDGEGSVWEGEEFVHPLLPAVVAVANTVKLSAKRENMAQYLLVSGSNMAGKSTLLRAMGVTTVMALAGSPVPAQQLRLSALRVGASLALVDSLAEGRSKFLAEVERLRDVLASAREGGCLFLIDEVFSGTNSADRRIAAGAVLRGLVQTGAVGAMSTHDLALAELVDEVPGGHNVHMASSREDDPLGFDYRVKDGVNRTTNALAIVGLLGLR